MKKTVLISVIISFAVAALLWWRHAAAVPGQAMLLSVSAPAPIAPLDSSLFEVVGRVEAGEERPLLASTAGQVRNVFFTSGDYVRRGQPLVKLANHSYVLAPHNGFLGASHVVIGQYLAHHTLVTTISTLNHLVVPVQLPRRCRAYVRPGDSVRVWVTTRPGRMVSGTVHLKAQGAPEGSAEIIMALRAPFRIGEQAHVRLRDHHVAKAL